MEDEGMMEDAPRKTQLWRVDHNSTFYFKRTPSPTSSSPTGSSVRRQRISLRFFTTSNREWWDTTDDEREDSEHLGLVATTAEGGENLADGLQRFDNAAEHNAGTWEKTPRELPRRRRMVRQRLRNRRGRGGIRSGGRARGSGGRRS
ncbi:unnamed protein product [Musa banksii]